MKYKRIESGSKSLKRISPLGMKRPAPKYQERNFSFFRQQVQVLMASSALGKGEPYTTRMSVCAPRPAASRAASSGGSQLKRDELFESLEVLSVKLDVVVPGALHP